MAPKEGKQVGVGWGNKSVFHIRRRREVTIVNGKKRRLGHTARRKQKELTEKGGRRKGNIKEEKKS